MNKLANLERRYATARNTAITLFAVFLLCFLIGAGTVSTFLLGGDDIFSPPAPDWALSSPERMVDRLEHERRVRYDKMSRMETGFNRVLSIFAVCVVLGIVSGWSVVFFAARALYFRSKLKSSMNLRRRNVLFAVILCVLVSGAQAAGKAAGSYGPYQAKVLRVVDGDTVQIEAAIWPGLSQRTKLRLAGVNTPEKRGRGISACEKRAGRAATEFTKRFLAGARAVTVSGIRSGKYAGRMLGSLHVDGESLEQALLDAGHARPYRGGRRHPWCQN